MTGWAQIVQSGWRAPGAILVGLALGLTSLACDAPGASTSGKERATAATPLRVVSLDPTASTFALELGAGASLVAVDRDSSRLPGLRALPVTTLADAAQLQPDLVLVPALRPEDVAHVERLRALGSQVEQVAPRSYDDVFALCRGLGVQLAGEASAAIFEVRLGRELGALGAESHGLRRLRVAAVRRLDPLELAPAHGFETDLIELAGGTSLSHTHEPVATPTSVDQLAASAPDLVLVVSDSPLSADARAAARSELGAEWAVEFFAFDPERFWVRDGGDTVRRLRELLARTADELEARRPPQSP